jgi:hypothetical protein
VKKQTSIDLVHNSAMTPISVTFGRRVLSAGFVLALAVACTNVSPPPSLGPTATPAPTPTPTHAPTSPPASVTGGPQTAPPTLPSSSTGATPEPTPQCDCVSTPGPSIDPTTSATIDGVTAQVPPIRELEPTATVPYQVISRDDFSNYLLTTADEDTTPEWRAAEERFLKRMGLLPQDANLDQMLHDLYTGEVAAYYNPADKTFYLIQRDAPFGPVDKVTTAHEYTHALQDQHFDLEGNRITDPSLGDAALGQLAIIEGDATLTSQNWMLANMSPAEQAQLLADSLGEIGNDQLNSMPLILARQLEFPYVEGFLFTRSIYGLGGYDAINQAIQTPPASTEQILHDDKYTSGEAPVVVSARDLTSNLGGSFSNVYQQAMGELNIQILATGGEKPGGWIPGLPAVWPHSEAAAGWGGDRLSMYEDASGGYLIDWQTTWDTQADADEFSARMTELQPTFQGSMRLIPGTQSVRFLLASDPNLFLALPSG